MFTDGKKLLKIQKQVNDKALLPVSKDVITDRLVEWGYETPPKPNRAPYLTLNGLKPYKVQLLKWENEGRTITEIWDLFQNQFGEKTSRELVTKALHRWQNKNPLWRGIDKSPLKSSLPIPPLPIDLLSSKEQLVLRENIKTTYLKKLSNDKTHKHKSSLG